MYKYYQLVGIRQCYENMRRIFLEQQSGKELFVENQAHKYRSRRERVCGGYKQYIKLLFDYVHWYRSFNGGLL